jgi:hypothetical protein
MHRTFAVVSGIFFLLVRLRMVGSHLASLISEQH